MKALVSFIRLWIWFSLRHHATHRWRALAVLCGIALGAAVFTSVRLAVNASLVSFTQSVDTIAGKAEWTIARPGGRVPESIVAELFKEPAIEAVSPLILAYVRVQHSGMRRFLLVGLDPILDRSLRTWEIKRGDSEAERKWLDLISQPGTLLMSRKLMEKLRIEVRDVTALQYSGNSHNFRVIGELTTQGLALADAGYIAITDISTMQEFTSLHGVVDRMDIVMKQGASNIDLENIRAILPAGVILTRPSETRDSGRSMIQAYQLNLSVLSFVSLFVGMFLVYSLISLNATSRRHELAVMRSIGASSGMLFLLFIAEGVFFGLLGWLLAIPLSSLMIPKLLDIVSSTITHLFVRVSVDQLDLNPWEILLSCVITVGVSVIAAYQPARNAMKVAPKEAFLMHEGSAAAADSTKVLGLTGFCLIFMVWPLSRLPPTLGIPLPGYIATFFLFSGFSLLSPWFLRVMGSYLPPLIKRIGGEAAYLGGRYMRDAGTRMAISVGALITAMALFFALVIMVHSFRNTVETWVNQSIRGDHFLQTQMANTNQYRDHLPQKLVSRLLAMQDEIELLPYRRMYLNKEKVRYLFELIDLDSFSRHGRFLFLHGDPQVIFPKLLAGKGVIVSEVFASQMGLKMGDRFDVEIGGRDLDLPILGVYRDYRTQGGVVHYSLKHYQQLTGDLSWTGARVFLHPKGSSRPSKGEIPQNDHIINKIYDMAAHAHGVEVTNGNDLRHEIMRIFDETFAITTVLLLIALFVAALGITTTLTVLVLERTKELNTLLAVGASFRQIQTMIFWEAILMVSAGVALGAGCGFVLSHLLIYVINKQSFGWTFLYSVDWWSLVSSLPLILATALIAALPASRSALSQSPATLLRER